MALTNDAPAWNRRIAGHAAHGAALAGLPVPDGCLFARALIHAAPIGAAPPRPPGLRAAFGHVAYRPEFLASPGGRLD
jgi:hypothetical protein